MWVEVIWVETNEAATEICYTLWTFMFVFYISTKKQKQKQNKQKYIQWEEWTHGSVILAQCSGSQILLVGI